MVDDRRYELSHVAPRIPRPNEPWLRVPLVQCGKCGTLHEAEPECCQCLEGIDDWDGAASHYCGRCASRMGVGTQRHRQEERILDLERKLSRVLDAAQTMEARLPDTVEVTIHGYAERGARMYETAQEQITTTLTMRLSATEVDTATRRSLEQNLEQEVRRKGDWSTLQKHEKRITKLEEELFVREARIQALFSFVEQVVRAESKHPHSVEHTRATQRCAYRLGGRHALEEVFFEGEKGPPHEEETG